MPCPTLPRSKAKVVSKVILPSGECHEGRTHLLSAHEIPKLKTGLETLQSKGVLGVCLDPAGSQGPNGLSILEIDAEEVLGGPFVELKGVDIWDSLLPDEVVEGDKHGTLVGGTVQLRLGRDFYCLCEEVSTCS